MEKGKVVRDNGPGVSVLSYKELKRNSTEGDKYISLCPPLERNPTAVFGKPNTNFCLFYIKGRAAFWLRCWNGTQEIGVLILTIICKFPLWFRQDS